jgi:hypothetical protein
MTRWTSRALLGISFFLLSLLTLGGCSGSSSVVQNATKPAGDGTRDDILESARQLLAAPTDLNGCIGATQQLNSYLGQNPERRPAPLSPAAREFLEKRCELSPEELAEVESTTYSTVDAMYVDFALVLRDAVRSLGVEGMTQAERAATVFAWVVRQMGTREDKAEADLGPLPAEYVMRHGNGTSLERGYVFLTVLQQLEIPGCFLVSPGTSEPWACGVLVSTGTDKNAPKQILLFDHRLGLPLPGTVVAGETELSRAYRRALSVPGSKENRQIATLAALRKEPKLLDSLSTDEKHRYDVGPDQVKNAEVHLAPSLTALAPRTLALQDDLLAPLKVRLAVDPQALVAGFGSAEGVDGPDSVRVRREALNVLRRFVPADKGGSDKTQRAGNMANLRFDTDFRTRDTLPPELLDLSEPADKAKRYVAMSLRHCQFDGKQPRDYLLRGRLKDAAKELHTIIEDSSQYRATLQARPDIKEEFAKWKEVYVAQVGALGKAEDDAKRGGSREILEAARRRKEDIMKAGQPLLVVLIEGNMAEPRLAQAHYLQALVAHEQAEQAQARADAAKSNPDDARRTAESAWNDAIGWWETFIQEHPSSPFVPHARLVEARAEAARGHLPRARALLEDTRGSMIESDRLARLFLVRQLPKGE